MEGIREERLLHKTVVSYIVPDQYATKNQCENCRCQADLVAQWHVLIKLLFRAVLLS